MRKAERFWAIGMCLAALAALLAGCGGGGSQYGNRSFGTGNAIVFMRNVAGDKQVWMMNLDGSGKVLLVNSANRDIQGELSPDGKKLAYVQQGSGHSILIVKDLHTGNVTTLVDDNESTGNDFAPAWSPDGAKIAYHDDRDSNIHVCSSLDGSGDVQLTTGGNDDHAPSWSPDGSKVIFDRGWNGSICEINASGTGLATLVPEDTDDYGQPEYLYDGKIIFAKNPNSGGGDVMLANADGSGVTNLTPGTDSTQEFFPSSTGNRIAFATDRNEGKDCYISQLSGASLTNLVNLTADTTDDCWRPKIGYLDKSYFVASAMSE